MYYTCSHCNLNFITEEECIEHEQRHNITIRQQRDRIYSLAKENKELRDKIVELEKQETE